MGRSLHLSAITAAALWALPAVVFSATATAAATVTTAAAGVAKTAEEVIARNAAARGGLEAWRHVERVVWLGHVEPAVQTEEVMLPKFVMHLQRPNRTRFEIKSKAASFTRIFDGGHGWREHNGKDGRPVVTPFSKSETDYAKDDQVIDGLLLDAASKGVKVSLDGLDMIEGQRAYRLSLKLSSGAERKAWVDVKTNLDIRYDRPSGTGTDPNRPVPTFYREWSAEDGLVMPHVIETGIAQASPSGVELPRRDRVVIEHVIINPVLDASTFAMPASPMRRNTKQQIHIDTGAPNITPLSR